MLWDVKLLARLLLFRDLNSKKENRGHVFASGSPSQNSRHHAGMVCMVIPPKRGLEYL